jgi:EpsI family protein
MSRSRLLVAIVLIAGTGVLAAAARRPGVAVQPSLDRLPYQLDEWSGREAAALDAETLQVLGADAYLNRSYAAGTQAPPVGLYIAYYGEPRPGVSVHSPLHCLPGTGWETLDIATVDLGAGNARRMVVRKNTERAVVLYWYSVHGRVLASEVLSRAWLLHDSVRLRRSDAALVRIVVPVAGRDGSIEAAGQRAVGFARDVLPYLPHLWS